MTSERAGDELVDRSGLRRLTLAMIAICCLTYVALAALAVGSAITQVADGAAAGGIVTGCLVLPPPAVAVGAGRWVRRTNVDSVVQRLIVIAITLPLELVLLAVMMFFTLFF